MEDIAEIKCQIHYFRFEECFIQDKKDTTCQNFCQNLCVDTSFVIYNCCEWENIQCLLILKATALLFTFITNKP